MGAWRAGWLRGCVNVMPIVGSRSNPTLCRRTCAGWLRLYRGWWCLTHRLHFKNSAMFIANECTEWAQVLTVHFIEIPGLIGHRFADTSQVHVGRQASLPGPAGAAAVSGAGRRRVVQKLVPALGAASATTSAGRVV